MNIKVGDVTWDLQAAAEQIALLHDERVDLRARAGERIAEAERALCEAKEAAGPLWDEAQALDATIATFASAIVEASKPQAFEVRRTVDGAR